MIDAPRIQRLFHRRQRRRSRRGSATVEMAVVLPVFLLVVLAIIEFGRAMMVSNMVTSAAREGVRLAVIDGNTNSDVEAYIDNFLQDAIGADPADISTTIQITPAAGNPDPLNEAGNAGPEDLINITVQIPYDDVSYIPGDFLSGKMLRGHARMHHE